MSSWPLLLYLQPLQPHCVMEWHSNTYTFLVQGALDVALRKAIFSLPEPTDHYSIDIQQGKHDTTIS